MVETFPRSSLKQATQGGRDVLWVILAVLLAVALGSDFFDQISYPLTPQFLIPYPRFMLVFLLVFALLVFSVVRHRVCLDMPSSYLPLLLFWYTCQVSLIGILWSGAETNKVLQFIKTDLHLTVYVVFVYAILKMADWNRMRFLLRAYYGLGIVAAILAVMQYVRASFGWFPWMSRYLFDSDPYSSVGFRAASLFGEPSWAARYYVHWMALSLAFYSQSRKMRYLLFLALFGIAFYLAASLSGYIILLAFSIVAVRMQFQRRSIPISRHAMLGSLLTGVLLASMWLLSVIFEWAPVPVSLLTRTIERAFIAMLYGGGGAEVRLDSILASLKVLMRSPLFGVGLGNTRFYIAELYTNEIAVLRSFKGADSAYAIVLSDLGPLGLIAFVYFLVRGLLPPRGSKKPCADWEARDEPAVILRFLQIDLAAQIVGWTSYADLLSPHWWFFVAVMLVLHGVVAGRCDLSEAGLNVAKWCVNPVGSWQSQNANKVW